MRRRGPAVADNLVYHVAEFGVEARRVETGERVWRFGGRTEGQPEIDLVSTPVVASDSVYVPGWIQRDTMYGHLFVLDAQAGTEQTRVELGRNQEMGRSTPAVTSDLVFAATDAGDLYAFGECGTSILDSCLID
ncbi:PQQ-binding-like beta-propeller repeat protein [Halorussus caseinilyticus]|uniref:PQQ-binding-like beta-propeller repeat protein n=1 Tax=Halorussus caseinilyticus TaxID=3034025 RepID=A0ABD5WKL2_9EURY